MMRQTPLGGIPSGRPRRWPLPGQTQRCRGCRAGTRRTRWTIDTARVDTPCRWGCPGQNRWRTCPPRICGRWFGLRSVGACQVGRQGRLWTRSKAGAFRRRSRRRRVCWYRNRWRTCPPRTHGTPLDQPQAGADRARRAGRKWTRSKVGAFRRRNRRRPVRWCRRRWQTCPPHTHRR